MMNFIPSKTGHEELEYQNRSGVCSHQDLPQSSVYLNNIKGDEDMDEGRVSEDEYAADCQEQNEEDEYLGQHQQQQIMNEHNIQAGQHNNMGMQHSYANNYNYNNNTNAYKQDYKINRYKSTQYGNEDNINSIVSPRTKSTKNQHHAQSLSMKENLPSKNYQNYGKLSTSPYAQKTTKKEQQQQYQANNGPMKSFEKSYQELTQQILSQRLENVQQNDFALKPQDLLLGQQQLLDLQKRKQYDSKAQEDLFRRLNRDAELQLQSKELLSLEQQRKEMEGCTFAPQTINRVEDQRTLSQFLQDQDKFQKNQSDKINILRFQIQEEYSQNTTHQPKINQKSEMIVQMKRTEKEAVHDRLYKISKDKMDRKEEMRTSNQSQNGINGMNKGNQRTSNQYQTQRMSEYELQLEQQNTFQPQINEKSKIMMRKGKVGDHLYQDALRRQEKMSTQQESVMQKEKSIISSQTRIVSNKTEQIVAMKFVREFENVCDDILHDPTATKIDYLQMGEILSRLHFLKMNGGSENENLSNMGQERKLVYDLWYNLRGDELGGVTKCNLCQLLLIVIGIFGFQLQTEEQIRQLQLLQNSTNNNNISNYNNTSLQNETAKNGRTPAIAHATLYLQERYTEEDNEHEDDDDEDNDEIDYNDKYRTQQQLEQFNQGNYSFQSKLQQFNSTQKLRKGFIDQIGNWNIPSEDAKYLQKEFDMLYRNRLSNEELKKTEFKHQNTFQPQILPQSKRLAENYREKLLEETANLIQNQEIQVKVPPSGKITHVDLLVFQKQAQMNERQKKNLHQTQTLESNCTFHPQTLSSTSSLISRNNLNDKGNSASNASINSNQGGLKKSNQLYQLSKLKGQKKDKDRNEIEYEKNFDECTFQPDIAITRSKSSNTLRKSSVSNNSNALPAKDADKAVERMRAANKQRADKNIMLSRGYNKTQKIDTQDKKKFEKTAPVSSRLYNDVPLYRQSKQSETSQNRIGNQYNS